MPQSRTYRVIRASERSRVGRVGPEGSADPSRLAAWESMHEARILAHQQRVAAERPHSVGWGAAELRAAVADLLRAGGPLSFADLRITLGAAGGTLSNVLRGPWFARIGGKYELTPAGIVALAATEED